MAGLRTAYPLLGGFRFSKISFYRFKVDAFQKLWFVFTSINFQKFGFRISSNLKNLVLIRIQEQKRGKTDLGSIFCHTQYVEAN